MDSMLRQFHRQYLQQVTNLTYPPPKLLAHPDVQQQLYRYLFDSDSDPYLPSSEYQRRVLKRLLAEILKEARDEDDEVSDDLMAHMGYLSSVPRKSEFEVAQTRGVLSYSIPDLPLPLRDTSTFDSVAEQCESQSQALSRVLIRESPQLLAAGSNVGLRTWEACLRLGYYLCTSRTRAAVEGANILELGAGTGLLSLICAMTLGANHVLATDGLPHVVEGIEGNILVNRDHAARQGQTVHLPIARTLDWTDLSNLDDALSVNNERERFDYVLGADITYHPELLHPLASLLKELQRRYPACTILICATVRNEKTMKLWSEACDQNGLSIRNVNEEEDHWRCPQYWLQSGLFHEQAFPIVIMEITSKTSVSNT